jgi:hypothetical protein
MSSWISAQRKHKQTKERQIKELSNINGSQESK